jgi:hypothetical protein
MAATAGHGSPEAIQTRLEAIRHARSRLLAEMEGVTEEEGRWRPKEGGWSLQEVVEHLVLAEKGGIDSVWKAGDAHRAGTPTWTGTSENAGHSIEEVIRRTWRARESAPPSAEPSGTWSLPYWAAQLRSCEPLLDGLARHLQGLPLTEVIHPHFLSGPLDALQRLEFIRFHLEHHLPQVRRLRDAQGA